jgi:hypothetical protein
VVVAVPSSRSGKNYVHIADVMVSSELVELYKKLVEVQLGRLLLELHRFQVV